MSLIFILLTTWLALVILIYLFQSRLIYFPAKELAYSPAAINLEYEDVYLNTEDGLQLHGWYIEHPAPTATLLFLHGNAGNISHRLDSIRIFHQLNLSVFIIDYRGYGNSEGTPHENGTYKDAEAAWTYLVGDRKLSTDEIVIFGRSLGGGVATWLAARYEARGLILESTFSSVTDIGRHYYPYLPVQLLARVHYPSIDRISQVNYPILIVHSPQDELVPYKFGQKLYDAAGHPKSFLSITGGHNDGFYVSGNQYTSGLAQFLTGLEK